MSSSNISSTYLPINTTKFPYGWQLSNTRGYYYSITPNQVLARAQTLSFTLSIINSRNPPDLADANAGFACSLAGINSCTVNGTPVTAANPQNEAINFTLPIHLFEDIYPPNATFTPYYATEADFTYVFPFPLPNDPSATYLVEFGAFNFNEVWDPASNYGCAFMVLTDCNNVGANNPHVVAAYPFNLAAGVQTNETLRNQLNCTPCPSCANS